jgi:hypothetical protein
MKHLKPYLLSRKSSPIVIGNLIVAILVLSLIIPGCKKDNNDPPPPTTVNIGDHYGGGIVFSVDGAKQHGLVAATADQSSSAPWFNGTFLPTTATSTVDGADNTQKIISAQGNTGTYAAKLCKDYNGGGFHDWFLPSKDQLAILYLQKSVVGGFVNEIYWSSTEYDVAEAWVLDFTNGDQNPDNTSDGANVHTRAIRAF